MIWNMYSLWKCYLDETIFRQARKRRRRIAEKWPAMYFISCRLNVFNSI